MEAWVPRRDLPPHDVFAIASQQPFASGKGLHASRYILQSRLRSDGHLTVSNDKQDVDPVKCSRRLLV
jgi:hypothetical protein